MQASGKAGVMEPMEPRSQITELYFDKQQTSRNTETELYFDRQQMMRARAAKLRDELSLRLTGRWKQREHKQGWAR